MEQENNISEIFLYSKTLLKNCYIIQSIVCKLRNSNQLDIIFAKVKI